MLTFDKIKLDDNCIEAICYFGDKILSSKISHALVSVIDATYLNVEILGVTDMSYVERISKLLVSADPIFTNLFVKLYIIFLYRYIYIYNFKDVKVRCQDVYMCISDIFVFLIIQYIRMPCVLDDNVKSRYLELIIKENIHLNSDTLPIAVKWTGLLYKILISRPDIKLHHLKSLYCEADSVDLTFLTRRQRKICSDCIGTDRKIYLKIILLLAYQLDKIYKSSLDIKYWRSLDLHTRNGLDSFFQTPLVETVLLIIGIHVISNYQT